MTGTMVWGQPGKPRKGWRFVDLEDLREATGACEMCGTTIRYVHHLEHPAWPGMIGVGCICAGHLENDYVAPRERERAATNRNSRLQRWMKREWKTSRNGNPYIKVAQRLVVLFPKGNGWGCKAGDAWGGWYGNTDAAKRAAFDLMYPEQVTKYRSAALPPWVSQ